MKRKLRARKLQGTKVDEFCSTRGHRYYGSLVFALERQAVLEEVLDRHSSVIVDIVWNRSRRLTRGT